jgi:hypothetical protein
VAGRRLRRDQSLERIFARIERRGYILFRNPGQVGQWCGDAALSALGASREEAMAWPELNAGAID